MSKRLVSLLLVFVLAICLLPLQASAGSLSNFYKTSTYTAGLFTDVPDGEWYANDVKTAYEYGLIGGTSPTTYSPGSIMTIAEAIKVSACLHSIFHTGSADFPTGIKPWYQPYADYALAKGIIASPYSNYRSYATRSDMAVIFANALPDEAMTPINQIPDNAIPDVSGSYSYGAAVYKLYKAGILTGSGDAHAFKPNDHMTRAEIAAIIARLASSSNRVTFSISPKDLPATEIAAKCSPAVFYILLFDASGNPFASGSGFFIRSDGLAVTNFHVVDGASSAKILTTDGSVYDVAGVYDYNKIYDLALLQIDGTDFPYLETGDSATAVTGATIYAIGSPKGFDNTLTQGIISNASRKFSDSPVNYIQVDAAISNGSSGGALINTKGQVIGVTTAGIDDAQNINFAVPINLVKELRRGNYVPLSTITPQKPVISVTASSAAVSVSKGAQTSIIATASSGDFASIAFYIEDESIISCSWGDWNGNTLPLTIKGLNAGTTALYIGLLDKYNDVLAETSLRVTVTGGGSAPTTPATPTTPTAPVTPIGNYSAPSYPGLAQPLPDFGAFINAPLYDSLILDKNKSSVFRQYYYKLSDLPCDAATAMLGYADLMAQYGFTYRKLQYGDDDGLPFIFFDSDYYDMVLCTVRTHNGVQCLEVFILKTSYYYS